MSLVIIKYRGEKIVNSMRLWVGDKMLCYIIIFLGECSVPLLEGVVAKITLQAVGNGSGGSRIYKRGGGGHKILDLLSLYHTFIKLTKPQGGRWSTKWGGGAHSTCIFIFLLGHAHISPKRGGGHVPEMPPPPPPPLDPPMNGVRPWYANGMAIELGE